MTTSSDFVLDGLTSAVRMPIRSRLLMMQRVGPIWTGDNTADWRHLRVSVPMVLSISITGIAFSGVQCGAGCSQGSDLL